MFSEGEISTQHESMIAGIETMRNSEHQENSYIGKLGHFIEPVMRPLGFDWSIIKHYNWHGSKEIVVNTSVYLSWDSQNQGIYKPD